jgi:hypothetical protein
MNENYKQGLMEGHNEDDSTHDSTDFDYYDENIEWDEWE